MANNELQQSLSRFGRRWRLGANKTPSGRESFAATRPQGLVAPDAEELQFADIVPQMPQGQRFQAEEANPWGEAMGGIGKSLGGSLTSLLGNKIKGGEDSDTIDIDGMKVGTKIDEAGLRQHLQDKYAPAEESPTFLPKQRPSDALYAQIERRQGKDFKGKDKDQDHNILDVLKTAGLGALKSLATADPRQGWEGMLGSAVGGAGAGGVAGGIDASADERLGNEINLAQLMPKYQQQAGLEAQRDEIDQNKRLKEAQIGVAEATPGLRQAEIDRKKAADVARAENAKAILADKATGRELTSRQIDDLARYRDFLIENGTRITDGRIKQIDERLKDYDLDRKSREDIAGMREGGQNRRVQAQIEARKALEEYKAAQKSNNIEAMNAAREKLAQLKATVGTN